MTTTHATRGHVWRETYYANTDAPWRYWIDTWQNASPATSWAEAYRLCLSAVLIARVADDPPF